jgi:hypothetical protein
LYENRLLRRIFGLKKEEVAGGGEKSTYWGVSKSVLLTSVI